MKVICITPAGRRASMSILAPYILSEDVVDEWQVWLNTNNPADLAWLEQLAKCPRVRAITPPLESPGGNRTINQFWRFCDDPEAMYVRLDDDVVWLEKDFFANLIEFRKQDDKSFIVSAMVINNALCSYVLQISGLLKYGKYLPAQCMDPTSWKSGEFAEQLHKWAVKSIQAGILPQRLGNFPIAMNRFSINAICFYGKDIQPFIANVNGDEEELFSCMLPTHLHKANIITTNCWCCHYSFYPQIEYLSQSGILEQYQKLMQTRFMGTGVLQSIPPVVESV